MSKAMIRISYRQEIHAGPGGHWENNVLHASYQEFLLKSQAYNKEGRFRTFSEMVERDGRAHSLHYKAGFAIGQYIEKLQGIIPHLEDSTGKAISFAIHKFEILESNITDKTAHKVAITYFTEAFVLCRDMGEYLLLGKEDPPLSGTQSVFETFLLKIQPGLGIFSYAEVGKKEEILSSL